MNMFATIVDSATGRREDCCRGALRSEAHTVAHVKTGQKEKVKTCLEDLHDFEGASGWLVQVTVEVSKARYDEVGERLTAYRFMIPTSGGTKWKWTSGSVSR